MKGLTKALMTVAGTLGALLQVPAVQNAVAPLLAGHPGAVGAIAGLGAILALAHNPNAPAAPQAAPSVKKP